MINKDFEQFISEQNKNGDFIDIRECIDEELTNIWIHVDATLSQEAIEQNLLKYIDDKCRDLKNYVDQFLVKDLPDFDSRAFIEEMDYKLGIDQNVTNKILTELVRELKR